MTEQKQEKQEKKVEATPSDLEDSSDDADLHEDLQDFLDKCITASICIESLITQNKNIQFYPELQSLVLDGDYLKKMITYLHPYRKKAEAHLSRLSKE
jgi:hypothetical protein